MLQYNFMMRIIHINIELEKLEVITRNAEHATVKPMYAEEI